MATGQQHYAKAEQCSGYAHNARMAAEADHDGDNDAVLYWMGLANFHATMAIAAFLADSTTTQMTSTGVQEDPSWVPPQVSKHFGLDPRKTQAD